MYFHWLLYDGRRGPAMPHTEPGTDKDGRKEENSSGEREEKKWKYMRRKCK